MNPTTNEEQGRPTQPSLVNGSSTPKPSDGQAKTQDDGEVFRLPAPSIDPSGSPRAFIPMRLPSVQNLFQRNSNPQRSRLEYPSIPRPGAFYDPVRDRMINGFSKSQRPIRPPCVGMESMLGKRKAPAATDEGMNTSIVGNGKRPCKSYLMAANSIQDQTDGQMRQRIEQPGIPYSQNVQGSPSGVQSNVLPGITNAQTVQGSASSGEPNTLPSMAEVTRPSAQGSAHSRVNTTVGQGAQNYGLPFAGVAQPGFGNRHPRTPRMESPYHPSHYQRLTVPPKSPNAANSQPRIFVENVWQNVFIPPKAQISTASPAPYCQRRLRAPRPAVRILPNDSKTAGSSNETPMEPRVYDLAKIRQLGFTVVSGRVYNQQNHPMCAAPRDNGNPCKRNVSRSPCKWHGEVSVLTRENTKNGMLDDFGNLIRVGPINSVSQSPGPGEQNVLGYGVPLNQPFTPPTVVTRTLRWNNEEHYWFLLGLQRYGHKWSIIAKVVGTRNTLQVQSHAQKFFERQKKVDKKKSTIHDLTIDSRDMDTIATRYSDEEREKRLSLTVDPEQAMGRKHSNGAGPSSYH